MTEPQRSQYEQEKFDEKEREKRDEKSPEEKSWEEKYRRDPLGSIIWALILIWAGLVFLASNLGWLDKLERATLNIPGFGLLEKTFEAWSVILLGVGVILFLEVILRLTVPAYRRPVTGTVILAVILIGVALGDLISWDLIWPVILIVLGASFLLRGLFRKR